MGYGTGSGPYGTGTPATATVPAPPGPDAGKYISHVTGDYEREADGSYKRMPRIRQRVVLALGTIAGSSSVLPKLGTKFPDKIDDSFDYRVKAEVQRALLDLTNSGEIRIDAITIERPNSGRAEITVAYTASDGTEDAATV